MKNKFLPILFSSFLILGAAISFSENKEAFVLQAYDDLSVSNTGDGFVLLDKEFSVDEGFVYTGELYYHDEAQAGGLVFGGVENEHYYVLTLDRYENHIKLLDFRLSESRVDELYACDFIGNNYNTEEGWNVTEQEWRHINPQVRTIPNVNMKVVVSIEEGHAYTEIYVEGIRRFRDTTIDLNKDGNYVAGKVGLNVFNGSVTLKDIQAGKSDYSYFTEAYRNQYHFQPFAKWTNDPNALVYYNGWYHIFYQTNPFGLLWSDMYWGHARSRDLIHFEYMPLCLFPSNNDDGSVSYMWSGCAVAYYKGMSEEVDSRNWFPKGNGNGLFAIYTEDRCGGYEEAQNQMIITSDDEGLTWIKRDTIYQRERTPYYDRKIDWRDPKIFPAAKDESGKVTTWGMSLSSYALNKGWLMQSTDLINWRYTQQFALPTPECIGIGQLEDEEGVTHTYLTNKSRTYLFGSIGIYNGDLHFVDEEGVNISTYSLEEMKAKLKPLDFGPDSYASQSFYISDPASEYYGKDIVINWFSGDLNASYCTGPGEYASLRGRWNGGFTTPVEYGIYTDSKGEMRLSQKAITVNNEHLDRDETKKIEFKDYPIDFQTGNLLKDVHSHTFELEASITVKDNAPIIFKVDVGEDEYMQFGWNSTDGYYVDRTYLDDKGINTNIDWHTKYASHILGDSDTKTFYVLNDNGGLEVFCEDYSIPFYFVTTADISSNGASLFVDGPVDNKDTEDVLECSIVNYLRVNEIKSAYQKEKAPGEGALYVSSTSVSLDTKLSTSKFVSCWYTGESKVDIKEISNTGAVEGVVSDNGISLKAIKEGTASYKVSADEQEQIIEVKVNNASFESDFTFNKDNIISGSWSMTNNALIGEKPSGNGFILAEESASDFTYTGTFDINYGTAGALVFRAQKDMSSYLVCNYDAGEKVVKLWSAHGELTRSNPVDVFSTNVSLSIKAVGSELTISINGNEVIQYTLLDNEPLAGYFGVNVFSSKVTFKNLSLIEDEQTYDYTDGELEIDLGVSQFVSEVYNVTKDNTKLQPGYYRQSSDKLYISKEYFGLLDNGTYIFKVVGSMSIITVTVNVNKAGQELVIHDVTIEKGLDVNVYVGSYNVSSISVNGNPLDHSKYHVQNYVLTIDSSVFNEGQNEAKINNLLSFKVTVKNSSEVVPISTSGCGGSIASASILLSSLSLFTALLVIISIKRRKEDK